MCFSFASIYLSVLQYNIIRHEDEAMVSNDDRTVADARVLWCFCAIFIDKERQGKTLNAIWFDMKNDCFYFVER